MKQLEILFQKTVNIHSFEDISETINGMKQEITDLPDSEFTLQTKMGRNVSIYLSDNTMKALGTIQSATYKPDQLPVMLICAMAFLQRNPDLLDAIEGLYTPLQIDPEEEVPTIAEDATETVPYGGPKVPEVETIPETTVDQPKKRGRKSRSE